MRPKPSVQAIIDDLYQGTLDDVAWDRGLMGLAKLVGGEGPLLISINPATNAVTRHKMYSYDSASFKDYSTYWAEHDPRIQFAMRAAELDVLRAMAIFDRKQWENTAIYNDYLKPNDAPYSLPCTLRNSSTKFTAIAIQATNKRGAFDQDDGARVSPLMPHVRRALEIKDHLEHQELHANTLRGVADGLSFGMLVLDEQRKILEASSFATAALQTVCSIAPRPGQALQLPEPSHRELSLLLASSLQQGRISDGLLRVSRGQQQLPLSILVAPAPITLQSWILSTPKWLLLVFDPEQCVTASRTLLESELYLSPREAQIASLLAMGLRLPHIAYRLGISLNTLRTHLKACLAKTGCHSQAELVGRVLRSAASIQPARHCPPNY